MLKAIGSRLVRVAADGGVAVRLDADAFLLVQAAAPGERSDADELLGRPIVVKESEEPLTLALGIARAEQRVFIDALVADAEAALAPARDEDH